MEGPAICPLLATEVKLLPWLSVLYKEGLAVRGHLSGHLAWGVLALPCSSEDAKHGYVLCRMLHYIDCHMAHTATSRCSCSYRTCRPATF